MVFKFKLKNIYIYAYINIIYSLVFNQRIPDNQTVATLPDTHPVLPSFWSHVS